MSRIVTEILLVYIQNFNAVHSKSRESIIILPLF